MRSVVCRHVRQDRYTYGPRACYNLPYLAVTGNRNSYSLRVVPYLARPSDIHSHGDGGTALAGAGRGEVHGDWRELVYSVDLTN